MQRQYWQGYSQALDHTQTVLRSVWDRWLTEDPHELIIGFCRILGELAPEEDLLVELPTNAMLAEKYGVSVRTVTNWRREGCPFEEGQHHVLNWAMEQRLLPRSFKVRFARQLQKRREKERERMHWDGLTASVQQLHQQIKEARKLGFL